jgi:hypothetical protein
MTEMNSKSPLFELVFGIATGLVTVLNPLTLVHMEVASNRPVGRETISALFGLILMFVGPGLLVSIGSYIHAAQEKTAGFVLTMIGGSILVLEFPLLFIGAFSAYGGIVYRLGLPAALYMLTPSPLAALTMVAAVMVRRSLRQHSIGHLNT